MTLVVLKEHFSLPYVSVFVDCRTGKGDFERVTVIGVKEAAEGKTGRIENSQESLPIFKSPLTNEERSNESIAKRNFIGKMALCVKPFHYEWHRALWLIEFVEFYRLLGVTHFVFYNHTVSAVTVNAAKQQFLESNAVTLFPLFSSATTWTRSYEAWFRKARPLFSGEASFIPCRGRTFLSTRFFFFASDGICPSERRKTFARKECSRP